jgi:hypothetical protein
MSDTIGMLVAIIDEDGVPIADAPAIYVALEAIRLLARHGSFETVYVVCRNEDLLDVQRYVRCAGYEAATIRRFPPPKTSAELNEARSAK